MGFVINKDRDWALKTAYQLFTDRTPAVLDNMVRTLVGTYIGGMATCPQCDGYSFVVRTPDVEASCGYCIRGIVHASTATTNPGPIPEHPNYRRRRGLAELA